MAEVAEKVYKPYVLVADDSRVVRRTIVKYISPYFNVIEAENGVAAWRLLNQSSRIEVVITDIQMPEMDGYSFICKIRAEDDAGMRDIPIIVITSADDETTRDRAYACGANDFVLKPFNTEQLLNTVRSQLGDYRESVKEVVNNNAPDAANEEIVLANKDETSLTSAITHIDTGMRMLASLKSAAIAPHALTLVLRFMPLLKFCNTRFNLGMDREIAVLQQGIATARENPKKT